MNPLTQSKNRTILAVLIALTLGCYALSPQARATCQESCSTFQNTVLGDDALLNNSGESNTAIGAVALEYNTTGSENTAIGAGALHYNTTAPFNTATGSGALYTNTTGTNNTATGASALQNNGHGSNNTADGSYALSYNRTGSNNTAIGASALQQNEHGNGNTASGVLALRFNTTGDNNTAIGHDALLSNTAGSFNIALGAEAGGNLTTGSNNIDIANRGVAGESDTIRIGTRERHTNTFIAGIDGVTVPSGVPVIIDIHGHLGTTTSSARFKDDIKPMDKASEAILALKPVTFCYKKELDSQGIPQFGLVAEEVEKVSPDLVARDGQGKAYTVRYEAVNAMLLNEFLKEHREVQELKRQVAALPAGLQKVNAQLELSRSAPRTVLNDQ